MSFLGQAAIRAFGILLVLQSLAAAPLNDAFENATLLPFSFPVSVNGTLSGASIGETEPVAAWDREVWQRSVWWKWRCDRSGPVLIQTSDPTQDLALAVFQQFEGLPYYAAFNEDEEPFFLFNPALRFFAEAGETYWIVVLSSSSESGAFKLNLSRINQVPPNDNYLTASPLGPELPAESAGSNINATVEAYEPFHADEFNGHSVWWQWTAPAATNVIVSTAGSSFDTLLGVYTGTTPGWLEEIGSNDDATGGTSTSAVRFRAVAGTTYFFAVDGFDNASGTIKISLAGDQPKKAPTWTLPDLEGNLISWAKYSGKVVVLDFWATWCGPCIAEIPDFIDLQNQYGAEGLAFIGVSLDRDPDYLNTVRNFALQYGMNYDVVYDRQGVVEELFGGISSIPTTFIIDRHGAIVEKFVGTHSKQAFENEIKPLLAAVIVVTPPVLSAALVEGKLVLSWPDDGGTFTVKAAAALHGPWNPVPSSPRVVGASRQISLEPTEATFFRLVAQ